MNASNLREKALALRLAFFAVVGRSPAHGLSAYRLATLITGFALTVVYLMELLVVTGLGVGVNKLLIVQGRATVFNRLAQDLGNGAMKASYLDRGERFGRSIESQPGRKENFVGVDVADASHDVLIGEDRFERC